MWEATVDNRVLTFRLAGINNQNFIMRDEETGTWWQQVSGEAILGPLKGRRLTPVIHDELSFSTWKREQPRGRVLRPDERLAANYASADWEERVARAPVVTPVGENDPFPPRTLIIGISVNSQSRAYPLDKLKQRSPVLELLGGVPLLVVVGDDKESVRAFDRTVDDRALEFFAKTGSSPLELVDSETGSVWDFTGKAVSGPLAGKQLRKIPVLADFWFDWKIYNPNTSIYQ